VKRRESERARERESGRAREREELGGGGDPGGGGEGGLLAVRSVSYLFRPASIFYLVLSISCVVRRGAVEGERERGTRRNPHSMVTPHNN